MVVLPTPALDAIASMDSSDTPMPSAIRSSVASMIAFSAFSLRGRPAGRAVVDSWIVIAASHYRWFLLFHLLHRACLARHPLQYDQHAQQRDDRGDQGRDVHAVEEGVEGGLDQRLPVLAERVRGADRRHDRLTGGVLGVGR